MVKKEMSGINRPVVINRNMYFGMAFQLVALALSGCGVSNVVIEGSFPTPNINKIPVAVAVYYDDALREFSYIEYSETGREEFNIESGQSHMDLFNAMLPAMFDRVIVVDNLEDARAEELMQYLRQLSKNFSSHSRLRLSWMFMKSGFSTICAC